MRTTKLRSKFTLLFMTFALVLAIPAIALADTVNVDDVVIGQNATKAPGDTGTAQVFLNELNSTGDVNGCNATGSTPARVTLTSNNSDVTITSPGYVDLSGCGSANAKSIEYSVSDTASAGTAIISVASITGGRTGSTWKTSDTLTITITEPATPADTTPPTIEYVLNPTAPDGSNDWYKGDVTLTWTVTESESAASLVKTGCEDQNI